MGGDGKGKEGEATKGKRGGKEGREGKAMDSRINLLKTWKLCMWDGKFRDLYKSYFGSGTRGKVT